MKNEILIEADTNNPTPIADDILNGVNEIAEALGQSRRRTYHLLTTKQIPAFQLGRRWHARRSTLLSSIENLEKGGAA
jgi:excisionase family DNA binding protein